MIKTLLATAMFIPTALWAQTNIDLSSVSITTSRIAQKTNETGRSISIIEGSMFQQLPVHSIDELLKFVPGVEVQSRGPMGAQSDIVLRGGTYQQVLVLLDGIKVNDPITGHFSSYIPIAPAEIERIEILRGPAAAIYGAEAVGGVIHVISKTFNQYQDTAATKGFVTLTGGEYNLFAADAGLRITGQKANGNIGILSNSTTGQYLRGKDRGYIYNHTLSGSVAFKLAQNWQLSLRSSYDNRDFAAQNFYTTFISDTATEQVKSLWNQAQLRKETKTSTHQFDAVYKQTSDFYRYNTSSIANENDSRFIMAQYINTHQFNEHFSSSSGAQMAQRSILSNDRGNHQTAQGALFATVLYKQKSWRMSTSLRSDFDQQYGFAILPQLNLSYVLQNITLRANAGKATRSADFTERYNNYNKKFVKGGSVGNPHLEAEKSWSYEVGAIARLGNSFSINSSLFLRNQNDVIDWVNTPFSEMPRKTNLDSVGVYALAKNIKKLYTKGAEIELIYQKKIGSQHTLNINVGGTFIHSESNDPNPSFYIIAHAKWLLQSTIIYQYKKTSLAVNILYKERATLNAVAINAEVSSSYWLANMRAAFRFNKHWQAFVSCNNLGDLKYSDLLGSKMPNRWWSAGASLIF
jgi:iron complex outermembrane receptor protein